ncbi:DMT family transporter [Blastococcus mobilis]|uniref:Permease of the drug/metabolite transporter (DMT) superfamily n=1 Tax=Blastococcus mobilis TaxID=1938746 RepID=A0A238YDZ3_9ACTN|nr:DMT family transporter [Blastococcus mobilis]SNR69496.1 Permease of the drug/metabolite transporter (DMT) superfamily [Blastococcus mobilis]
MTAAAADSTHLASRRRLVTAVIALAAVTVIWGSTFSLTKDLLTRISVTDYLALRFLTAAAVVALVRPWVVLRLDRRTVKVGASLGVLYCLGQALQFFGLPHTSATVSAFVVSMYVVFTPLLAATLLRSRPDRSTVVAVVLATGGVATMSLRGWALGFGELLTLAAAALYAAHILALSRWSTARTAYPLTLVQLLTMGACFLIWTSFDGVQGPGRGDLLAFLYLSVVAGAVALLVQTWAQAHVGSAQAAVLMVLEPVWAAFFGFALWHESVDARTLIGGGLVLASMVLVVLRPSGSQAAAGAAEAAGVGAVVIPEEPDGRA